MYSESISKINFGDVYDADIIFISINTFNAVRGYKIAEDIRKSSSALIVFGGMHASLNYPETIEYCNYILTMPGRSCANASRTGARAECRSATTPGARRGSLASASRSWCGEPCSSAPATMACSGR